MKPSRIENLRNVLSYNQFTGAMEFRVTKDHLTLLSHMQVDWEYGDTDITLGCPQVDSKRPYGMKYQLEHLLDILRPEFDTIASAPNRSSRIGGY